MKKILGKIFLSWRYFSMPWFTTMYNTFCCSAVQWSTDQHIAVWWFLVRYIFCVQFSVKYTSGGHIVLQWCPGQCGALAFNLRNITVAVCWGWFTLNNSSVSRFNCYRSTVQWVVLISSEEELNVLLCLALKLSLSD